jgi:hypothetical protein
MFGSDIRTNLRGGSTFGEQAIGSRLIGFVRPSTLPGWALGILLIATVAIWRVASDPQVVRDSFQQSLVQSSLVVSIAFVCWIALRRFELALSSLPFLAAAMSAPEIPGMPFIREFGSVALLAVAARLALAAVEIGPQRTLSAVRPLFADRAFLLLCLSGLAVIPAWIRVALTGPHFNAKVVTSHVAEELLTLLLVTALSLAGLRYGKRTLTLLFDSIFVLALLVVASSAAITIVACFNADVLLEHSYLGFFYYCRPKLIFFGPDHLCTFIVAVTPVLLYKATTDNSVWRQRAALAALVLVPLLAVATGSRSGRIELLITLGATAMIRDFRRVAIPIGLLATALIAATFGFRCVTDFVHGTNYGGYVPAADFLSDSVRSDLRANFLDFISPVSVTSLPSALFYLSTIFFGVGTGLTAYAQFGIGTHMAYFNLIIDKGIVGSALLSLSLALLIIGIVREALGADAATRRVGMSIGLCLLPFPFSAAIWDVRGWLFFWFFIGLAFAFKFALYKSGNYESSGQLGMCVQPARAGLPS